MEEQNRLIAADGRIVHLGEGVLSFLNLKLPIPLGYPSGTARRDDIVIYADRALTRKAAEPFRAAGIAPRQGERCALFIGTYGNPEVQPVEKYGDELFSEAEDILLDIFFSGNAIKIMWEKAAHLLTVQINEQTIACGLDRFSSQLILYGEDGVRYFRDETQESRYDSNEVVLSGQRFHSLVRRSRLAEADLYTLFPPEAADAIREEERHIFQSGQDFQNVQPREDSDFRVHGNTETGRDGNPNLAVDQSAAFTVPQPQDHYFFSNGEAVSLRCRGWCADETNFLECEFLSGKDILENLRRQTERYKRLVSIQTEQRQSGRIPNTFRLWGNDENLSKVKLLLQKACDTNVTVLLTGESGTGKTFLAREIHRNGKRREKEFVHVNCAAIPYNLIESELFGYEAGAFTGAKKGGKKGYFELADGGTIFLDEITEMPLPLQGKLLEVIQNRTFYRVGGTEKISVNVRLIAATNRDLREQVAAREFREDLYYRINVFPIELPPLRKRRDAIHAIVADILPGICGRVELEPLLISPQALDKMKEYEWPGNVRELENILEKAAIMCDGSVILPEDVMLPEREETESRPVTLKEQKELCEKQAISEALSQCRGDRGLAARRLDIGRTNLFEKMRKYGIGGRWTGGQDDTE